MSEPQVPGAASARAAGSTEGGCRPPTYTAPSATAPTAPTATPPRTPARTVPAAPDAAGEGRDVERGVVGAGVDGVVQGAGQVGAHRVAPVGISWMSMVCASGSGPSRDSSWPIASKR